MLQIVERNTGLTILPFFSLFISFFAYKKERIRSYPIVVEYFQSYLCLAWKFHQLCYCILRIEYIDRKGT